MTLVTERHVNLIDIPNHRIYAARITIDADRIAAIDPLAHRVDPSLPYALPGFVDAHVHIESSMLLPSEFAHGRGAWYGRHRFRPARDR